MEIIYLLLPFTLFLSLIFLGSFLWSTQKGQFDDLKKGSYLIFEDDEMLMKDNNQKKKGSIHEK